MASKDFAAPAQKYVGKLSVDSGPVPFQRWSRAYTRKDRDRKFGAQGTDLRGEVKPSSKNPKLKDPSTGLDRSGNG